MSENETAYVFKQNSFVTLQKSTLKNDQVPWKSNTSHLESTVNRFKNLLPTNRFSEGYNHYNAHKNSKILYDILLFTFIYQQNISFVMIYEVILFDQFLSPSPWYNLNVLPNISFVFDYNNAPPYF